MNALIRQKIARVLANAKALSSALPKSDVIAPPSIATAVEIAERILAGEKTFTIKQVTAITGYAYTTIKRHLRGKPGWLISPSGGIRISESLLKSYLQDQAAKGLTDVA